MNRFYKMRYISIILLVMLISISILPEISMAALTQPTVNLGTAGSYAVLAGSTITNTGTTTINGSVGGDIGLYPGSAFPGMQDVTIVSGAAIHIGDSEAIQAKIDLQSAYDDAQARTPVTRIPSELGGKTLTPGVYDSADGTFEITGTLTLDAEGDPEGVFIFKMGSTLTTAVNSSVVLINNARFCRTFWQVGSSATLGTDSKIVGHIFASESITANNNAMIQGQLLALNGAVTLDNNTISNGICDIIITPTPSSIPTPIPSTTPTPIPNGTPTQIPTGTPSVTPTSIPIGTPSDIPSQIPNGTPSVTPTNIPSGTPSDTPTLIPSDTPNPIPSDIPSSIPTQMPSSTPAVTPGAISPVTEIPIVTPPIYPPLPISTTKTVTGGQIPETATPWYNILFVGEALIMIGGIIAWSGRKH